MLTDAAGYILTRTDLLDAGTRPEFWPLDHDPLPMETSRAGVFAAGDVRHGSTNASAPPSEKARWRSSSPTGD